PRTGSPQVAAADGAADDSLGSSLLPTIVRFKPICTATGVPLISTVVLPFRYQPSEPAENSRTSAISGTPLMVTVTGLAFAWKSARLIAQVVFLAIAVVPPREFGGRCTGREPAGRHHTTPPRGGRKQDLPRRRFFLRGDSAAVG